MCSRYTLTQECVRSTTFTPPLFVETTDGRLLRHSNQRRCWPGSVRVRQDIAATYRRLSSLSSRSLANGQLSGTSMLSWLRILLYVLSRCSSRTQVLTRAFEREAGRQTSACAEGRTAAWAEVVASSIVSIARSTYSTVDTTLVKPYLLNRSAPLKTREQHHCA